MLSLSRWLSYPVLLIMAGISGALLWERLGSSKVQNRWHLFSLGPTQSYLASYPDQDSCMQASVSRAIHGNIKPIEVESGEDGYRAYKWKGQTYKIDKNVSYADFVRMLKEEPDSHYDTFYAWDENMICVEGDRG